jgi:hypothetical protein
MKMEQTNTYKSTYQSNNTQWVVKPLNMVGNLDKWVKRMHDACPNPSTGQIVWLNGYQARTAYKVIGFKPNGDAIWQRGEVVKH